MNIVISEIIFLIIASFLLYHSFQYMKNIIRREKNYYATWYKVYRKEDLKFSNISDFLTFNNISECYENIQELYKKRLLDDRLFAVKVLSENDSLTEINKGYFPLRFIPLAKIENSLIAVSLKKGILGELYFISDDPICGIKEL